MERKIMNEFLKWKNDLTKKPLLLYGDRKVGKTYSVLEFGKKEYKTVAYIDAWNNLELLSIAKKEVQTEKIIMRLSALSGESILKKDTLIVLDNVNDIEIVKMVKLFGKADNEYDIIMITQYKENVIKYKGEELNYRNMYSMDFEEYLIAIKEEKLVDYIKDSYKTLEPCPFHQIALDYFNDYIITGGLPESINNYINNKDIRDLTIPVQKAIDAYKDSIITMNSKNLIDIERSLDVFNIIPYQLIKDNKKFMYGMIKTGARTKEYESAIDFLANNNIIHKTYKITDAKTPLQKYKDKDSFKLYISDTGVLFNMMHISKMKFLTDNSIKNILYEVSVANSIRDAGYNTYYYASEGKAEVSFLVQSRQGKIIPIELVNKNISKAKSLTLFMNKFNIDEAIRVGEDNFQIKKNVKYIPIYATFCFRENL